MATGLLSYLGHRRIDRLSWGRRCSCFRSLAFPFPCRWMAAISPPIRAETQSPGCPDIRATGCAIELIDCSPSSASPEDGCFPAVVPIKLERHHAVPILIFPNYLLCVIARCC